MPDINPKPKQVRDFAFFQKILDDTASQLSEWFGAVQIHASSVGPDTATYTWHSGFGDWNARNGLAARFVAENQARTFAREISKALEPPAGRLRFQQLHRLIP